MNSACRLLVCIAFHYEQERIPFLERVLDNLSTYEMDTHIIIDTNVGDLPIDRGGNIEVMSCQNLPHPFSLTFLHRVRFLANLDEYDWFMYQEDDMEIPFENFVTYTENFELLWPDYVPSFVRLETFGATRFVTDALTQYSISEIVELRGKRFIDLSRCHTDTGSYHAFWIMPRRELKDSMRRNFSEVGSHRESAASYPQWGLGKIPLVMVEGTGIDPRCFSYHLPNNYASDGGATQHGKIPLNSLIT